LATSRVVVGNQALFEQLVKAAFAMRRKTLWNCLKSSGLADVAQLKKSLEDCAIDGHRRGETLTLDEFARLSRSVHTHSVI